MKTYLQIVKNSFYSSFIYRFHSIFMGVGNIVYIILIYFLWKSVYGSSTSIHGMSFDTTFIYLALASSIVILFQTGVDWDISHTIITGQIIMELVKPIDFQLRTFFKSFGQVLFNIVSVTLPTLLILFLFFYTGINIGPGLILFFPALCLSFIIAFIFDYIIGLSGFVTESIWGIATTKDVIIIFLSGALVPIKFFPPVMQKIIYLLPFQAIYNVPVSILVGKDMNLIGIFKLMGVQLLWIVILSVLIRIIYKKGINSLVINGG